MSEAADGGGNMSTAVVVAVKSARGRGSRRAVKWAVEKFMWKADRFVLVHVMPTVTVIPTPSGQSIPVEELDAKVVEIYVDDMKSKHEEILTSFRRLLKRRKMEILVLEGDNPASSLLSYITDMGIATLVLGSSSSKTGCFERKPKTSQVPSTVLKNAPHTCNIYVVSRHGLIVHTPYSMSTAEISNEALLGRSECNSQAASKQPSHSYSSSKVARVHKNFESSTTSDLISHNSCTSIQDNSYAYKSSFGKGKHETVGSIASDGIYVKDWESQTTACTEQSDFQAEVVRLRQELHSTLAMYNRACEDLVYTQKKVDSLSLECLEEQRRVTDAQKREELLRKIAEKEKEKYLEVMKEVEMAKDQCSKEACERQIAELNVLKESLEKQKVVDALFKDDKRYRRYTKYEIEVATDFFSEAKLIGEGAYGKVYKCNLDNTLVAIKVLWSDAPEKKREFLREIEVLSQLRHPHIVLLLGACPESGCLVYEYMENGSLEDHVLPGNSRPPLPWFVRFQIAYEVASGLAFLHNSGTEPVVHRDLKPGNILLDRNYVSKIGDVGLAKIISDVVPDNVTEYRNSILAGTLCYMDPEYQRTGTVRPKSDLYALGIIILQLLAACHPSKVIRKVEKALSSGSFPDVLDKLVRDWPLAETEELAHMALKCCKLRCRDRPELETEVLPVLKRLAEFADATMKAERENINAPSHYYCPILQEIMDDPHIAADGFTYEHIAIKTWLDRHNVSPVTKLRLQNKTLMPNRVLHSAIEDWKSHIAPSRGQI